MNNTILLADDSVTIRKVIELTLMDGSFDLVPMDNGDQAVARFGDDIDLVIADVHMPGADGYEVCQAVKKASPDTPVLLLVGTFEVYDESKAAEAGADDHLKKPFDSQELLNRVNALLAGRAKAATQPLAPPPDAEAASETAAGDNSENQAGGEDDPVEAAPLEASDEETQPDQGDQPDQERHAAPPESSKPVSAATPASGKLGSVAEGGAGLEISDESVDRIARRVVELLSEEAIRDVAWEVIPDLAEVVIKERLNELESQVE